MHAPPLKPSPEVISARENGRPVVALESTIIAHGMPHPRNLETARRLEDEVRALGAAPATIAVVEGEILIGLEDGQLERLARSGAAAKLSRADLAVAAATGGTGATTVAATMICASLAGIGVMATGGIGGVHRGAETTFDISADLRELARTPVTVVAAGAKAVLDLPKTLESLETLGVPVIGYRTDEFPAFWSRSSGLPAPLRLDEAEDIAAAHAMRGRLGIPGGQLVANPIPPADEIPADEIGPIIEEALSEAEGVAGKDVTPLLLRRVLELTGGRSLMANVALVMSNARLAAEIARHLSQS